MKRLLLLGTILIATSAFAFGGGGSNRTHKWYRHGVDSIGVHIGGACPQGSSTTGQGGETGIYDGGVMCKCTEVDKVYTVNGCELQPEVCTDHTTNQCGLGYYCQFSPYDCDDTKGGNPDGVCTAISGGTEITPAGDSEKTYLKGPKTDWWSAYSWCIGNGKQLVTGSIAGHALNEYYENYDGNGDIYTYFGQDIYFWTGHDSGDSCGAWYVHALSDFEDVYDFSRSYDYYALCE